MANLDEITIYANSHYVTPKPTLHQAIERIKVDLKQRLEEFRNAGKLLEAERLEQRTNFDLEMLQSTGSCAGIENYSRYLTGRRPGDPPPTLFEYLPKGALLIIDESHVTVPQIGGMFRGDFNRKSVLAEFGFRLPSAHRQPAAEIRGMGRHAPELGVRLGHTGPVGDGAHRRRLRRADHPPHRPDRPAHHHPPGEQPGR